MASVTALTNLNLRDLWREVKDPTTLWGDVSRQTLRTVKLLLENRMHEELADFLNAGSYTRGGTRRGYRNGCYIRQLTTTYGTIPDLEIPRARHRGFAPSVLPRYPRP
ncbi:MAG TPA: transposase [bacterium]|nr:transposase [bacterium]